MRIVTWNCYSGTATDRFAELTPLCPDIVVLQECSGSRELNSDNYLWFGDNSKKGLAVFSQNGFTVSLGPHAQSVPHSVFPLTVSGPIGFNLLAVWSLCDPTYARAINCGLDAYACFIKSGPTVIAGDFNTHPLLDARQRGCNHSTLVERLGSEFGLVSAYHAFRTPGSPEEATLYYKWKQNAPFHIDYCFIPRDWLGSLREVSIGSYEDWQGKSDHRPLLVDLAEVRTTQLTEHA